jgi:peroxiredoxin (alkyl hydroperoxide reductase subunit C)
VSQKHKGCVATARGPIVPQERGPQTSAEETTGGGEMQVMVGKPAPDFEATAFMNGGFNNLKLSDFMGKWVTLCFYPGDFTFV